jgi:hypothetical protein
MKPRRAMRPRCKHSIIEALDKNPSATMLRAERAGERFCPRTAEAGFIGTTWPVMSQSNSEHADSTERVLALQDAFERAIEGPDHNAGARRDSGDHFGAVTPLA